MPATPQTPEATYWRDYFDRRARGDSPDHSRNGYVSEANARFMRGVVRHIVGTVQGQLVLDVGSGDGRMTAPLASDNEIVAVDFSAAMLSWARERGLAPICADMLRLPLPRHVFDLVVCVEAMTCLPRPLDVLDGLIDVLRPGGHIVIGGLNGKSMLRRVVRPIAAAAGARQPALIPPDDCRNALERLGVDPDPLVWVAYYPAFTIEDRPGATGWAWRRVATNFVIRGRKR